MIKFVVCLLLILTPLSASAEEGADIEIEKGGSDLLKAEGLSRPFTIFDQLLYSLGKEAVEAAKAIQPIKNDFTPRWPGMNTPTGQVGYSRTQGRVFVTFDLNVTGMNDPWREVCERHIRYMADHMMLRGLGSQSAGFSNMGKLFLRRHLGTAFADDDTQADSLQPFMDALVVMGRFYSPAATEKTPAHLRSCALDIKTDRMTYYDYSYEKRLR
jgi:hypothetical protein